MVNFVMVHDIVEANGKTIKENNLGKPHNIPVGSLVEVKYDEWHGDGACEKIHARLWVVQHQRDCDGTPLYGLSKNSYDIEMPSISNNIRGGFAEEQLTTIELTRELVDGHGALEW